MKELQKIKKKFIVSPTLYPSKILVLYNWEKDSAIKLITKMGYCEEMITMMKDDSFTKEYWGITYYMQNKKGRGEYILVVFETESEEDLNETLVHETNHLAHFMATRHGFLEEMEAVAYLQEYLFKEIKKQLWNKKELTK